MAEERHLGVRDVLIPDCPVAAIADVRFGPEIGFVELP
jgi:hypothetical protein